MNFLQPEYTSEYTNNFFIDRELDFIKLSKFLTIYFRNSNRLRAAIASHCQDRNYRALFLPSKLMRLYSLANTDHTFDLNIY